MARLNTCPQCDASWVGPGDLECPECNYDLTPTSSPRSYKDIDAQDIAKRAFKGLTQTQEDILLKDSLPDT